MIENVQGVALTELASPYLGAKEYKIEVPKLVEGQEIYSLNLVIEAREGIIDDQFIAPLNYNVSNDKAFGLFFANPQRSNYYLHVWYGGVCGPRWGINVE